MVPVMSANRFALVSAVVLAAAVSLVPAASSAGQPSCVVSNPRTGFGTTSLQAAINAAAANDTLVIKGTCLGNSTIDRNLTLNGVRNRPFGAPTLDGSGFDDSVLTVARGVTAVINNLTIVHGTNTTDPAYRSAGGITNSGSATLADSTVSGNARGIFNALGALTLVRSNVIGNTGYGIEGEGGVITLSGSSVSDNLGGGLGVDTGTVTLTDSTLSGNSEIGLGGTESALTVDSSTVTGNGAGGISIVLAGLQLNDSVVSGNTHEGFGGGITNFGGGITLRNTTVSGNTATYGGGIYNGDFVNFGRVTLADSTVSGNDATVDGGGIYNTSLIPFTLLGTNAFTGNVPNDCVGVVCS
jgi:hypothetical protein